MAEPDAKVGGLRQARRQVIEVLDNPRTPAAVAVSLGLLAMIYVSVTAVVIEFRYPDFAETHAFAFHVADMVILAVFGGELLLRLVCYERPLRYLFSWMGLIDVLAVVPGLVAYAFPTSPNLAWLRTLRILRLLRVLKFIHVTRAQSGLVGGITKKILPFIALAVGIKGVMVSFETASWWPVFGDLTVVVAVTGFGISILLGTKLGVANRRLYDIEDGVARIVGSARYLRKLHPRATRHMQAWARELEVLLTDYDQRERWKFQERTDALEQVLLDENVSGPAVAMFHRDVEFILHRAASTTPPAYERFLRSVTGFYSLMVLFAIPGITGFLSTALVIYVLGGMYVLIDDMDRPMEQDDDSLISADLHPLSQFNAFPKSETPQL
jgi:hypothetical protein